MRASMHRKYYTGMHAYTHIIHMYIRIHPNLIVVYHHSERKHTNEHNL